MQPARGALLPTVNAGYGYSALQRPADDAPYGYRDHEAPRWLTVDQPLFAGGALMKGIAFDLLIVDVMMPGASGLELTRRVRAHSQVPILIHAGRGMAPMDALADIALRYHEVPLVLAHAGIAGQGMFASRLKDHPSVVYDTSTLSPFK